MAFAEDLDVFFSLDTPGSRAAVYQGDDLVVLFDTSYFDPQTGVLAAQPVMQAPDARLPGFVAGSEIDIAGVIYRCAVPPQREHGTITAQLQRAGA